MQIICFSSSLKFSLDHPVTVRFMIPYTGDERKPPDKNLRPGGYAMENQNIYSKPVTLRNILRFAVPTIAMSVFMSFYTMVDGLFVCLSHVYIVLEP